MTSTFTELGGCNWASEASPTLAVQSRFHVICICYSTGRSDIRDIFHEL